MLPFTKTGMHSSAKRDFISEYKEMIIFDEQDDDYIPLLTEVIHVFLGILFFGFLNCRCCVG